MRLYIYMCPQPREISLAMITRERQLLNANFHDSTVLLAFIGLLGFFLDLNEDP